MRALATKMVAFGDPRAPRYYLAAAGQKLPNWVKLDLAVAVRELCYRISKLRMEMVFVGIRDHGLESISRALIEARITLYGRLEITGTMKDGGFIEADRYWAIVTFQDTKKFHESVAALT